MHQLRVGIMGLGSIFHRVMTDLPNAAHCKLTALAARDAARARTEAEKYGVPLSFGSYEELVQCPEVDLVYIATPHNLHHAHTLLALGHKKHVLCEKAFAMNPRETGEMIACARQERLFLMEAMWTRFLPAMGRLKEMLDSGELGEIRHIDANFSYAYPYTPASRVYDPALGGGALMDVGVYPLSVCCMLLGRPDRWQVSGVLAPSGVDRRVCMQLGFGEATCQCMAGVDVGGDSRMRIFTTRGLVEVPDFWHATSFIFAGKEFVFPPETEGHHHQFEHAAACIARGETESPVMPLEETAFLMNLIFQMRRKMGVIFPGD